MTQVACPRHSPFPTQPSAPTRYPSGALSLQTTHPRTTIGHLTTKLSNLVAPIVILETQEAVAATHNPTNWGSWAIGRDHCLVGECRAKPTVLVRGRHGLALAEPTSLVANVFVFVAVFLLLSFAIYLAMVYCSSWSLRGGSHSPYSGDLQLRIYVVYEPIEICRVKAKREKNKTPLRTGIRSNARCMTDRRRDRQKNSSRPSKGKKKVTQALARVDGPMECIIPIGRSLCGSWGFGVLLSRIQRSIWSP